MAFVLSSPAFEPGAFIPTRFTCDGADVSPPLTWRDVPAGAAVLALVVDDPDANGFSHWVVADIPVNRGDEEGFAEGASAALEAPTQGLNDFRRSGWGGPCPPSGTHRYRFTLYALDAPLGLAGTPTAAQVRAAASGHILGQAELVATYRRGV
jgi:hypothetical protein